MEESPLYQPHLQCEILSLLNFEDAVRFLSVLKIKTSDCPIKVTDQFGQSMTLPGINPVTTAIYRLIKLYGIHQTFWGAVSKPIEIMSVFLKAGFDVNSRNGVPNETLLMRAAGTDNPEMLSFLIQNGADITLTNYKRETALHYAARNNQSENIRILLKEYQRLRDFRDRKLGPLVYLDAISTHGNTPLLLAVRDQNVDAVRTLLEFGADPDVELNGETALFWAVELQDIEIIKMLLKAGANVDQTDPLGETALFRAILHGDIESVKALIEFGADVNFRTQDGDTPLTFAEQVGNRKIIQLLLEAGAH